MPETIIKACIPIIAMIVIGLLCGYALYLGYDGVLLSAVVALIAGLGGFTAKAAVDAIKKQEA